MEVLWEFIGKLYDLLIPHFNELGEVSVWIDCIRISKMKHIVFEAIIMKLWWTVWNIRSNIIFRYKKYKKDVLVDRSIESSYS